MEHQQKKDKEALPAFRQLHKEGVRAKWVNTIFPSLSYASWTTLSTGKQTCRNFDRLRPFPKQSLTYFRTYPGNIHLFILNLDLLVYWMYTEYFCNSFPSFDIHEHWFLIDRLMCQIDCRQDCTRRTITSLAITSTTLTVERRLNCSTGRRHRINGGGKMPSPYGRRPRATVVKSAHFSGRGK